MKRTTKMMRVSGRVHLVVDNFRSIKGCTLTQGLNDIVNSAVEPEALTDDARALVAVAINRTRLRLGYPTYTGLMMETEVIETLYESHHLTPEEIKKVDWIAIELLSHDGMWEHESRLSATMRALDMFRHELFDGVQCG